MREPTTDLLLQLMEIMQRSQTRRLPVVARRQPARPPVAHAAASKPARVPLGLAKS